MGGLLQLYQLTGNSTLTAIASNIVNATLSHLVYPNGFNTSRIVYLHHSPRLLETGILQEPCEPSANCDRDQNQFKVPRHIRTYNDRGFGFMRSSGHFRTLFGVSSCRKRAGRGGSSCLYRLFGQERCVDCRKQLGNTARL